MTKDYISGHHYMAQICRSKLLYTFLLLHKRQFSKSKRFMRQQVQDICTGRPQTGLLLTVFVTPV